MLVRRLHRLQASRVETIRGKLMCAGFRSREAVGIYAGVKLASPLLFGFRSFVLVYGASVGIFPWPTGQSPWSVPFSSGSSGRTSS